MRTITDTRPPFAPDQTGRCRWVPPRTTINADGRRSLLPNGSNGCAVKGGVCQWENETHPATNALAGSNRSGGRGNGPAGAFGVQGCLGQFGEPAGPNASERRAGPEKT